jgi:hypothetical protein
MNREPGPISWYKNTKPLYILKPFVCALVTDDLERAVLHPSGEHKAPVPKRWYREIGLSAGATRVQSSATIDGENCYVESRAIA